MCDTRPRRRARRPTQVRRDVFMFSGQGSQYLQMGRLLYDRHAAFQEKMQQMDAIVRELCGYSVLEALYDERYTSAQTFDRTLLSHPAIFMVEYATACMLMRAGVMPHCTLGASLGMFAAAAVAGYIDMEDALVAVIRQATMVEALCERGSMIAIRARTELHDEELLKTNSEIASFNLPAHFVISAPQEHIASIESCLRTKHVYFQRLPVSFAFHSRWIDAASQPFQGFLPSLTCRSGDMPLVCCVHPRELTTLPPNYLWQVVREPIRFHETIAYLESRGTYRYIDVGPAASLSALTKYSLMRGSRSTVHETLTPSGSDLKSIAAVIARR